MLWYRKLPTKMYPLEAFTSVSTLPSWARRKPLGDRNILQDFINSSLRQFVLEVAPFRCVG